VDVDFYLALDPKRLDVPMRVVPYREEVVCAKSRIIKSFILCIRQSLRFYRTRSQYDYNLFKAHCKLNYSNSWIIDFTQRVLWLD
jgi:hypothetical protein